MNNQEIEAIFAKHRSRAWSFLSDAAQQSFIEAAKEIAEISFTKSPGVGAVMDEAVFLSLINSRDFRASVQWGSDEKGEKLGVKITILRMVGIERDQVDEEIVIDMKHCVAINDWRYLYGRVCATMV